MRTQSIQLIDSLTSCELLGKPMHFSSLFHSPQTFPDFCSNFLKENQTFGQNYEEISQFLAPSPPTDDSRNYIKGLVKWIQDFEGKIPNLDKQTYRIFYIKILGMALIRGLKFEYMEFEEIIKFFFNGLKFQKFVELKQEFSDILFILLQNFFLILGKKPQKSGFLAELFLMKSMTFLIKRHYQDFSHDFAPIFIKTFNAINENCSKEVFLAENKGDQDFLLKKMNSLKILKKSANSLHFLLFVNKPENEELFEESLETFESLFGSLIYMLISENSQYFEPFYRKFNEFISIHELLKPGYEKKEEILGFEILKKELRICSQNEKNCLFEEKEEILFFNIFELFLQVFFIRKKA